MNKIPAINHLKKAFFVALWFSFLTFPILVIKVNPYEETVVWRWKNLFYVALASFILYLTRQAFLTIKVAQEEKKKARPSSRHKAKNWQHILFNNPKVFFPILGILLAVLSAFPFLLSTYQINIMITALMYVVLGLGLNIVVGVAGLLDLGYVAFYAIGAYTVGVLTSPGLGLFHFTFWQAMPVALLFAWLAGIILGLPVLRMRGDYLAIVTLGFGEIVRLLALSDWLKSFLGGTQGIQSIAQPVIGPLRLDTLQKLYYLILIGIAILAFISWRLKDSRLGRSWMAIREDEDVAQAMGINLVLTKLLAFSTGALFAGLAGTFGAAKLTSVYPHSMTFIVSINVLVLIIIGGMGSIPGVFVGGLVLVGLPGLLTEFQEYRFWFYGLALVGMMLFRPEGLWPEARRRLELHEDEEIHEAPSEVVATTEQ